jgi:low affinity Fe/Cu permease
MTATINASPQRPTPAARAEAARPDRFGCMAAWTARASGGRYGFLSAFGLVIAWAICGPFFRFSEGWQLVINTGTTIVTFLMVFLIQNAQNRESKAIHLKLDELIYSVERARNDLIDIENLTEEQLDLLGERYRKLAERHRRLQDKCEDKPVGSNGHP